MKELILVVDANDSYSQQLHSILFTQLKYNLHTVKNVQEALAGLNNSQSKPDMALVSTADPEAALSAIKLLKGCMTSLPVIVMTGGGEQPVGLLLDAGANDVLMHNASVARIRASLANTLSIRRMSQYISYLEQQCAASAVPMRYDGNHSADHSATVHDGVQDRMSSLLLDSQGHMKKLKLIEKEIIQFALHHCSGCMTHAAKNLGIGRSTLYRRVQALKLGNYISRENQTTRPMMRMSSSVRS
jgi:DNA-binding NtrC family response regulator